MKKIQSILENAVFAESVSRDIYHKYNTDATNQLNKLLMDKAQAMGVTLYEVCATYVPEITSDFIGIDWYKDGNPELGIETTIRLVRRDAINAKKQ